MEIDVQKKHAFYDQELDDWLFRLAAYEGTDALIEYGVLVKNERESDSNFETRKAEAFGFEYSRAIVELFVSYLFEKPGKRNLDAMQNDTAWKGFLDDCDLYGTSFEQFVIEQSRYASVYGHVGILVDKPQAVATTKAEESKVGAYPYVVAYHPQYILFWAWARDEAGRPYLSELLLQDEDGRFRYWTPGKWAVYEVQDKADVSLVEEGENSLGLIPFIWLYNLKGRKRCVGVSDIAGVARIDASILRDLSHGQEVIKYNAFPMMRKPKQRGMAQDRDGDDVVGPTAVLEFDPGQGEGGKPDWLEAKCLEPIEAILKWNDRKVAEIYRTANSGGITATETTKSVKSGEALSREFRMLNTKLAAKAANLEEAEKSLVYFWLLWQGQGEVYKKIEIERPRQFDVENLAADLENALSADVLVGKLSGTFRKALAKKLARQMLPTMPESDMQTIETEIDQAPAARTDSFGDQGQG